VTAIIVLTLLALAFLLFLGLQIRRRYRATPEGERVVPPLVDIEAFRNLTDPREEEFLRLSLSRREFRRIQRLRLRAATQYVAALSQAIGCLVQLGQDARLDPNPRVAASGEEILQRALRLKVLCLVTQWKLNVAVFCPTLLSPSGGLADRYLHVTALAESLPGRIAA